MDVNDENIQPVTDLGHSLGYSIQCIQSRLNSDSGAGANAGSGLGMAFVATEPLSELVWSTDKGPSNVTLSPPQSITGGRSTTEKAFEEEKFIASHTSIHVKSDAAKDALTTSPTSDTGIKPVCGSSHEYETEPIPNREDTKTAVEVSILHKQVDTSRPVNFEVDELPEMPETGERFIPETAPAGVDDRERANMMKSDQIIPVVGQSKPLLGEPVSEDIHADDGNPTREMNILLTSKAHLVNESQDTDALVVDQNSQARRPLEKLESTADTDIQVLRTEDAYGGASQKLGSEHLLGNKESLQKVEEFLPANDPVLDKHSPTNSRIQQYQWKGKEKALSGEHFSGRMLKKALSDGNRRGRMSNEEDDSHESVESCNTARWVSSGKRRWGFEEHFIVGSKRILSQVQETPGRTSYVKQDSSFMNWISCMMKGFSKSIPDEAVPLNVLHPDHARESFDKKLITYNKNQDAGIKTTGFQSIFQSLYCPRAEDQGTRVSSVDHEIGERSEDPEQAIIPKVVHGEKMNLDIASLLPVGKFKESTRGDEAGSEIQPEILSAKVASGQEKGNSTNSVENRSACNLEHGKNKGGVGSSPSLGKRKKNSVDRVESDLASEGRTTDKFVHRRDLLGSSWVTRFTPKISGPSLMSARYSVGGVLDCSSDKNNVGVNEQVVEDIGAASSNELQDCAVDNAGALAFNDNEGQSDDKSVSRLNPMIPAPNIEGSEAMASVFARRLDAFKHIIPSDITGNMKLLTRKESQSQASLDQDDSRGETDLNLRWISNTASKKMRHSLNSVSRYIASSSGKNKITEKQVIPLSQFLNTPVTDVPKGISDSVKRLRLSRSAVLKWMDSHTSLSNLEGFFLRLRLGKCETGLGGTGYYVSCITGTTGSQRGSHPQNVKNSISVIVGGFRCVVEARYVSNHDFLEDELRAWWSAISKSNAKIPSIDDLKEKVKMKKMLGL